HYGWVKHPRLQLEKHLLFEKLYNLDKLSNKVAREVVYDFDYSGIDSLEKFNGEHPQVMKSRIQQRNWHFDFDIAKKNFNTKNRLLYWVEKKTGKRLFEYQNYRII
ncbi:MAG TPA: hypothetical protein VKR32_08150, partial [Puia sp.]|nr:hypothetical protein [Puia sp.]